MKTCSRCKIEKDSTDFGKDARRVDGLQQPCKECSYERRYWYGVAYKLKQNFNITLDQYNALLEAQNGTCAMCDKPELLVLQNSSKVDYAYAPRLAVDHDHACCPGYTSCGACIRGLLCSECNTLLGKLEKLNLNRVHNYLAWATQDAQEVLSSVG